MAIRNCRSLASFLLRMSCKISKSEITTALRGPSQSPVTFPYFFVRDRNPEVRSFPRRQESPRMGSGNLGPGGKCSGCLLDLTQYHTNKKQLRTIRMFSVSSIFALSADQQHQLAKCIVLCPLLRILYFINIYRELSNNGGCFYYSSFH